MPTVFDVLYPGYCRARLAEMRKQLLVSAESSEVPDGCDVGHPRDSALDGGFGDDRTAIQHETHHIH